MTWHIDTDHSLIAFSVRHMMISKVRGRFERFGGAIDFRPDALEQSSVNIEIDAASISTRSEQRDTHLKSPDFLNVDEYPTIAFRSKRVKLTSENEGQIVGDLTIRGITNEVVLDAEYAGTVKSPWGAESAGFSATATLNRHDWGASWNVVLEAGGVLVGEQVKVEIELELVKQEVAEAASA